MPFQTTFKKRATIADIEAIPKDFLTSDDIAPFLGVNPHLIRIQAQSDPDKLGFPVIVTNRRVRIPKEGFLRYVKYGRMLLN